MKQPVVKEALDIRRMMMVVAMTAFAATHAFAAAPKTESYVTTDRITLGDVFDGVKSNADYYLAPAPSAGKPLILSANDLTRISEAFGLGWTPAQGPQQMVIRRSSNLIDYYEIQAALQEKLAQQMQGSKFDMELADRSVALSLPNAIDKELLIRNFFYNPAKGTFSATIAASAAPDVKKDVTGKIFRILQVPVLKEPLQPGDIIAAQDIELIDIRAADITSNMLADANKLIGQTPRRGISAMKPLMAVDVQAPLLIKKGQLVTMTLRNNIVSLTTQGRAMDNGATGEAIRVMNTTSKQIVSATVTGTQSVSIQSPTGEM